MRTGAWIVTLICVAGFVWVWFATGENDPEARIIVTLLLGIVWTAIVVGVVRVLLALGLLGPRRNLSGRIRPGEWHPLRPTSRTAELRSPAPPSRR
jgi:hypothetical protein